VPPAFYWSEWSAPDVLCARGTQKRTSLCGAIRKRLPPKKGRSAEEPSVYWPTCIVPLKNAAPKVTTPDPAGKTLEQCWNDCKGEVKCNHWTFDLDTDACSWHEILNFDSYVKQPNFLTGEKYCSAETIPAPYCAEYQKTYDSAPNVGAEFAAEEYSDCARNCTEDADCENWLLKVTADEAKTCQLKGAKPAGAAATDMAEANTWYFFGGETCRRTEKIPAMPEDAEELSYKEVCFSNQYEEEIRVNNTWNRMTCPSPCLDNGDCPQYAECVDLSDDEGSKYDCVCQLGMEMEGGRCIQPPPATPTPRPAPTLEPSLKATSNAVTSTASIVLIIFVAATLSIFFIFRIFNPGRFIHMNIELALILAHLCLLPSLYGESDEDIKTGCRNISIMIHFFFTAAFAWFVVEAVYAYAFISYAVRRNGMLSNMGNFMVGWGVAVVVIAFTVSFEYDNYGGKYQ